MAKSAFFQRDNGARKLLKELSGAGVVLRVGVFGDNAARAAEGDSGATLGEVAAGHEFLIPAHQPRSWLRATVDEERAAIETNLRRAAAAVASGKMTQVQALNLLGLFIVGKIQQRISRGIPPALSEKYEARKLEKYPGATTPLIASGQLRQAVSAEVTAK